MRAITLYQPWASWVAWGWKSIETRTHDRFRYLVGARIGIHAGPKWDYNAIREATPWLTEAQLDQHDRMMRDRLYPMGALVATASVASVRDMSTYDSDSALCLSHPTLCAMLLARVIRVAPPIPCRGSRLAWPLPPSVCDELVRRGLEVSA